MARNGYCFFLLCCSLQQPLLFSLPRSSVDPKDPIRGLIFMAVVAGKERRGEISEHAGYGGGLNGPEELLFPEKMGGENGERFPRMTCLGGKRLGFFCARHVTYFCKTFFLAILHSLTVHFFDW